MRSAAELVDSTNTRSNKDDSKPFDVDEFALNGLIG
jgi:hypothetical protein